MLSQAALLVTKAAGVPLDNLSSHDMASMLGCLRVLEFNTKQQPAAAQLLAAVVAHLDSKSCCPSAREVSSMLHSLAALGAALSPQLLESAATGVGHWMHELDSFAVQDFARCCALLCWFPGQAMCEALLLQAVAAAACADDVTGPAVGVLQDLQGQLPGHLQQQVADALVRR